jgi:hypothetical protein
MASPFAKYQSEQVQQIAPGFVEAYGRAGASIGQGLAAIGAGVGKGIEEAEKKQIELAKQQGALKPYLNSEVANVQRSIENGFLQVGKDGKVSITPGQEGNLDANKVGRAIDLYNQTDGGKKELKAADLAGVISTIQSYDTLEKQATEKAAAARTAKIADLEYNSKLLGNAKTLSEGILAFATEKRSLVDGLVASGNIAGANVASAEARALYDKAQSIAFDAYRSVGINIDSFLPAAPVQPPVRPAAGAIGSGASTLYTVNTPSETANPLMPAPVGLQTTGVSARPSSVSAPAAVQTPAPAPVDYGTRVDGTKKGAGFLGEIKLPGGQVATEVSVGVNINGKDVEIPTLVPTLSAEQKAFIANGGDPRTRPDIIKAATEHASKRIAGGMSPFNEPSSAPAATTTAAQKTTAPTSRNLLLGTMPTKEPEATTTPAAGTQGQAPTTNVTKPAYIQQAEKEIASLRTARQIYVDQAKTFRSARLGVAGITSEQLKNYEAMAKSAESQALKIDDSITEKMKALTAERTREETGAIATTKLSMEQGKAMDDRFPDFGQGYMAAGRAKAFKLYPDDPGRALGDTRIPGIKGESKEITDTIGSIGSFMEGTMAIESAIDSRLEEGKGFFDRFTLTSDDYENIAKGNVGEKILLASMRKAIVSGGNFSDADRTFVLEAIASINTLDATKKEEYFKKLNQVMAGMVFKMYDGKLKSMGVERHLELLSPEERKEAVSPTETAFRQRFGLNDNGQAAAARNELAAIMGDAKKNKGYASSRSQAESAVASFIDRAKAEAAARVPEANK